MTQIYALACFGLTQQMKDILDLQTNTDLKIISIVEQRRSFKMSYRAAPSLVHSQRNFITATFLPCHSTQVRYEASKLHRHRSIAVATIPLAPLASSKRLQCSHCGTSGLWSTWRNCSAPCVKELVFMRQTDYVKWTASLHKSDLNYSKV